MSEQIRVVIVDDIAETREHLTKLLSFEPDIEVVGAASSGEEALDLTGKLQPDILLMDINMPGMDGIATTERISATFPLTSIIMMSVQGEADYLRRSMLAGAREFLVKPFSSDELTASIRQVHVREKQKRGRMVVPSQDSGGDTAKKRGKVVTLSDSGGYIHDPAGITTEKLEFVMELKNVKRHRISEYVTKYPGATYTETDGALDHNPIWDNKAECAFPSATQNETKSVDLSWLMCWSSIGPICGRSLTRSSTRVRSTATPTRAGSPATAPRDGSPRVRPCRRSRGRPPWPPTASGCGRET